MPISSLLLAARSALTTALLSHTKTFDMSRLTLLRVSIALETNTGEAAGQTKIEEGKSALAGQHYLISIDLGEAKVEFEIIDRKRGLRTHVLNHLQEPEHRLPADLPLKEFNCETPDARTWSLEQLLSAAHASGGGRHFHFFIYGVADSARPIGVRNHNGLTEIIQKNELIAQLI